MNERYIAILDYSNAKIIIRGLPEEILNSDIEDYLSETLNLKLSEISYMTMFDFKLDIDVHKSTI